MNIKAQFFCYLAAAVCFLLAAVGEAWKYGARTRAGVKPLIALMPLGLLVAVLPTLWNVAKAAF
jgi:hypothetical protein